MKIFIDTNILISATVWPNSIPAQAFARASSLPNIGMICQQNIDEMMNTFFDKFRTRLHLLNTFLTDIVPALMFVPIPPSIHVSESHIRDVKERPVLRAAISAGADILLTGDRDFLESGLTNPRIMNASKFLELTNTKGDTQS